MTEPKITKVETGVYILDNIYTNQAYLISDKNEECKIEKL